MTGLSPCGDHLWRDRAFGRHAKETRRAIHGLSKCARIGVDGMGGFPLVHAFGAALIDHAFGVAHDAVVVLAPMDFSSSIHAMPAAPRRSERF